MKNINKDKLLIFLSISILLSVVLFSFYLFFLLLPLIIIMVLIYWIYRFFTKNYKYNNTSNKQKDDVIDVEYEIIQDNKKQ